MNLWPAALEFTPNQNLPNVYFLHEAHESLPVLRNTGQYFITNKKHKSQAKTVALRKLRRGHWLMIGEPDKKAEAHLV